MLVLVQPATAAGDGALERQRGVADLADPANVLGYGIGSAEGASGRGRAVAGAEARGVIGPRAHEGAAIEAVASSARNLGLGRDRDLALVPQVIEAARPIGRPGPGSAVEQERRRESGDKDTAARREAAD